MEDLFKTLSPREQETAEAFLKFDGEESRIAFYLGMSMSTVKTHMNRVRFKLGVGKGGLKGSNRTSNVKLTKILMQKFGGLN